MLMTQDIPHIVMKLCLHHRMGFVYRNLATTLQHWAAPGHLNCRVQRISLENGVSSGHRPHRAITDCSVARDAFCLRCKRIASIDDGTPKSTIPGSPRLHYSFLFGFTLGHAATAIE